jgi:hypothetical protein
VRLPLLTAQGAVTAGDGPIYFAVAHSLLDGDGLAGNDFRTPGYPIAITPALLVDRVIGRGEAELVIGAQHLLGVVLAVVLVIAGARWFSLWVGVAAGLLAAVSPVLLTLELLTYPDLLYACGLFAAAALLAEGVARDDRRLLVASGVAFGLSAYLKPAAQALLIVPFLVLLLSTRKLRPAAIGGALAAAAMLLTMSPWLIHNAINGTTGMSEQAGLTLFYRAFDDDRYDIPTDVPYGRQMRRIQLRHPSVAHDRLWEQVTYWFQKQRIPQREHFGYMGEAARAAIRRNAGTYTVRTADDVRRTVTDLATTTPGDWEGFDYYGFLHAKVDDARVGIPPPALDWAVIQAGKGLGLAWLVVTLGGLAALALPFAPDPRVRAAGCALLVTWLVAAITTSLGHGSLWRYSAGLAPLAWLSALGGLWVLWSSAAISSIRSRRSASGDAPATRASENLRTPSSPA